MYISSHLHQPSSPPNEYPWSIFGGLKEQLCCKSKIYLQYTNQWGCLKMYRFIISSVWFMYVPHEFRLKCWPWLLIHFLDCHWTIYVKRLYFCRHVRYHKNNHTFSPLWQYNLPHKMSRPLRSREDVNSYVLGLLWVSQLLSVKWYVCFAGQSALWRECVVVFVISYMPTKSESFDT